MALFEQGRYSEALEEFKRASYADPINPEPYRQMAYCWYCLDDPKNALWAIQNAIGLEPNFAGSYTTLAAIYGMMREFRLEQEALFKALDLSPYIPSARYNLAYSLFRRGLFKAGAFNYRAGAEMGHTKIRVPYNRWDVLNEEIPETLFIYQDQGFGDAIQFGGFIAELSRVCTKVVIETDYRLFPVFSHASRSFENVQVLSKQMDGSLPIDPLQMRVAPMFDVMLYMMEEKILPDYSWLRSIEQPELPEQYVGAVGVCWKGSPNFKNDRNRSATPEWMKTRIENESRVVSLVPNEAPFDWITPGDFGSFLNTLFVLRALSRVHTVDTAVAHLAGAAGVETHLYLPYVQDWRWAFNPYESVRLYQQREAKNWDSVAPNLI